MCICVYITICIYIYIYIYHTCIMHYTYTYISIYLSIYLSIHIHIYIYIHRERERERGAKPLLRRPSLRSRSHSRLWRRRKRHEQEEGVLHTSISPAAILSNQHLELFVSFYYPREFREPKLVSILILTRQRQRSGLKQHARDEGNRPRVVG